MSLKTGMILKWTCAAALLLGAPALWFALNSESTSYPDAPEDRELYICESDQTVVELTPRALHAASTSPIPLGYALCPKCKKPTARRATKVNGKVVPIPKDDFEKLSPSR